MNDQIVPMNHIQCTTDPDTRLVAQGVSTSIAWTIQGSYLDPEEDEYSEFIGMYYWPGFPLGAKQAIDAYGIVLIDGAERAQSTLEQQALLNEDLDVFFKQLRDTLGLKKNDFTIKHLSFIGGEYPDIDAAGTVLLSGTVREVEMIQYTVPEYLKKLKIPYQQISYHPYLTTGSQSLEVRVSVKQIDFAHECPLKYESVDDNEEIGHALERVCP